MSFYITLPSHGADVLSDFGKSINSQSDFSINLKKPLSLPINKYEVSLVEMTFKNSWLINLGNFVLKDKNNSIIFNEDIFTYDGLLLNELCRFLNEKFEDLILFKDSTTQLANNLANDIINSTPVVNKLLTEPKVNSNNINSSEVFLKLLEHDASKIRFLYVEATNIGIYVPEGYKLKITGFFAQLINQRIDSNLHKGFLFGRKYLSESVKNDNKDNTSNEVLEKNDKKLENEPLFELDKDGQLEIEKNLSVNPIRFQMVNHENPDTIEFTGGQWRTAKTHLNFDNIKCIENLYVYTDIIEDCYVGQDMKKLLRIVQVKSNFDNLNGVYFNDPHYVPIENEQIDRIRMIVRDSEGNSIKFSDNHSSVIYKLHFRVKNY
jgi:hypothetical protein